LPQFGLKFTPEASAQLSALAGDKNSAKQYKAVRKALGFMEANLRHPSLHTHKYETLSSTGVEIFEAYAENETPGAYRIFWSYGPQKEELTIHSIVPHPD
jgi:hypothetical protein